MYLQLLVRAEEGSRFQGFLDEAYHTSLPHQPLLFAFGPTRGPRLGH